MRTRKMAACRTICPTLRGVLFEEVVLALVLKPIPQMHPSAAEWCNF